MTSASENVRDALTEEDVRLRRVIGAEQRSIAALQNDLEKQILAALREIDPGGARTDFQKAIRQKRLQERVQKLTTETYAKHAASMTNTLLGVAESATNSVTGAIEESI